jgi:hypothetical protein
MASIGSGRDAIKAGTMPKSSAVISDTARANSTTGIEGAALTGTQPAWKARCTIRRAPAQATAMPAAHFAGCDRRAL